MPCADDLTSAVFRHSQAVDTRFRSSLRLLLSTGTTAGQGCWCTPPIRRR